MAARRRYDNSGPMITRLLDGPRARDRGSESKWHTCGHSVPRSSPHRRVSLVESAQDGPAVANSSGARAASTRQLHRRHSLAAKRDDRHRTVEGGGLCGEQKYGAPPGARKLTRSRRVKHLWLQPPGQRDKRTRLCKCEQERNTHLYVFQSLRIILKFISILVDIETETKIVFTTTTIFVYDQLRN